MEWCNDVARKHRNPFIWSPAAILNHQGLITILTLMIRPHFHGVLPLLKLTCPVQDRLSEAFCSVYVSILSHLLFLVPWTLGLKIQFFLVLPQNHPKSTILHEGSRPTSHFPLSYAVPGAFSFSWQVDLDGTEPTLVGYLSPSFGLGERVGMILLYCCNLSL